MNRGVWNTRTQEALELQGVAVVATDANGDLGKIGNFFHDAGLKVVCIADQVKDASIVAELCAMPFSVVFLRQSGLEELLAQELPLDLMRSTLSTAPHSRAALLTSAKVAGLTDTSLREEFTNFMIANKGSAHLHEWVLGQLDQHKLPPTLKNILDTVLLFMAGAEPVRMSLL